MSEQIRGTAPRCAVCVAERPAPPLGRQVTVEHPGGHREIDVKKYAKVEKIPGGAIEDSRVLDGVMFAKDVVLPSRMRRRIERPRVVLLDCPLEYKKGESQTSVEMTREEDWAALLKMEEEWTRRTCDEILKHKARGRGWRGGWVRGCRGCAGLKSAPFLCRSRTW